MEPGFWFYRVALPVTAAMVANLVLFAGILHFRAIPLESLLAFMVAWVMVQVILLIVAVGAFIKSLTRFGQITTAIVWTVWTAMILLAGVL